MKGYTMRPSAHTRRLRVGLGAILLIATLAAASLWPNLLTFIALLIGGLGGMWMLARGLTL
jgi:hypothetical protein